MYFYHLSVQRRIFLSFQCSAKDISITSVVSEGRAVSLMPAVNLQLKCLRLDLVIAGTDSQVDDDCLLNYIRIVYISTTLRMPYKIINGILKNI